LPSDSVSDGVCRARSTAGAWAESIEIGGKPEYQTLHSANELLLIRPRSGISRFQSSSRCGTHSFAVPPELPTSLSRPNSSLSLVNFTVPPASRPASRLTYVDPDPVHSSDSVMSGYGHEHDDPMTTFKYRRRQNHHSIDAPEQRSQFANETIAHLNSIANINSKDIMDRPQSAFSLTDARPAGVSRSAGGKKLGLNFSPVPTTGSLPYLSLPSVSPSLARSLPHSLPPSLVKVVDSLI
jgi:hypothetical protein